MASSAEELLAAFAVNRRHLSPVIKASRGPGSRSFNDSARGAGRKLRLFLIDMRRNETADVVDIRERVSGDEISGHKMAVAAGGNEDDCLFFGMEWDRGMCWFSHCFVQR